jgi:SnoaL-like domain
MGRFGEIARGESGAVSPDVETIVGVQQLLALYGHMAEEAKFQPVDATAQLRLDRVFAEDAVFDAQAVGLGLFEGLGSIREMFAMPWPFHPPSHASSNVYVYEDDGVRAISKWNVVDWDGRPRVGTYEDEMTLTSVGWRIGRRVATQLWGRAPMNL